VINGILSLIGIGTSLVKGWCEYIFK
jgi:hypothetical protein